jgi:glucose-6-phosphate isomerase
MADFVPLTDLPEYGTLKTQAAELKAANIEQMLATDNQRAANFSASAGGLTLDYSKQLLSRNALSSLLQLGTSAKLKAGAAALLGGEPLNSTEGRPALHSLLRAAEASPALAEKFSEVLTTRTRMKYWADRLNSGQHTGYSGETVTHIVNIGIGGSDLGPRLVTQALQPFHGPVQ